MGCHFLLQEIFPTQGLNPGLLHCGQMLYHLSHHGSPMSWEQSNSNFTRSLPSVPAFSKLAKLFPTILSSLHTNLLSSLKLALLVDGAAAGDFLWLVCRHRHTTSMPLICCRCCSVSNKESRPTLYRLQHASLPCSSISRSLLKLMSIESVMPSNHLILSPPCPLAFNLPQHQGLFQWVGSSHQVSKVLELQLQSFQWIFRVDLL